MLTHAALAPSSCDVEPLCRQVQWNRRGGCGHGEQGQAAKGTVCCAANCRIVDASCLCSTETSECKLLFKLVQLFNAEPRLVFEHDAAVTDYEPGKDQYPCASEEVLQFDARRAASSLALCMHSSQPSTTQAVALEVVLFIVNSDLHIQYHMQSGFSRSARFSCGIDR